MKVDPARRTNVSNTKRSKGTVKSTDLAFTSVLDAELRTEQSTANLKVSTVDAYCLLSQQRRTLIKNKLVLEPPES
ncbi:MAG: hypothetical protein CM15mP62_29170 [Rhodospirillaceae bacterium]|nr:MAG: hypothetical protein CM15mP62_29170 [Rhodospirillaceae bacterium]